jgi:hypothetical protein
VAVHRVSVSLSLLLRALSVEWPILAWLALASFVALGSIAVARRNRRGGLLLAAGVALLALAAAMPRWHANRPARVVAFVDVSASTRGAAFRSIDALRNAILQLTGRTDVPVVRFADGALTGDDPALADVASTRTALAIDRDVEAALLFTDGRLTLTRSPQTHVIAVVDPRLSDARDGRIEAIERAGDRVVIDVLAAGPRVLRIGSESIPLNGSGRIERRSEGDVTASLDATDRWPENDAMTLAAPLSRATERWWIGDGAPSGFRAIDTLPADLLRASVIVLANVPAHRVDANRLASYVRDLGGSVVMVGGDQSLGAGGYIGTPLDAISPLTSAPPRSEQRWVMLIDASGSMSAQAADGRTRLGVALDAVERSAARLPADDRVDVATFARTLTWHARGAPPAEIRSPQDVTPTGPTNLRAAINELVSTCDGTASVEVILLSDGQADLGDVASLRSALAAKRVSIRWLALSPATGDSPLGAIAQSVADAGEPVRWATELQSMIGRAQVTPVETTPVDVAPWNLRVLQWNRTWLRTGATLLAHAGEQPIAARWQVGMGRVATVAFTAPDDVVQSLARDVAAAPVDPALSVDWSRDEVRISARSADGGPSNGRRFTLRQADRVARFEQTAPGEYVARAARDPVSSLARVIEDGQLLDARTIPSRPPEEFEAIGTDVQALRQITDRVVLPSDMTPLHLPVRERRVDVSWVSALLGSLCMALALLLPGIRGAWRDRYHRS